MTDIGLTTLQDAIQRLNYWMNLNAIPDHGRVIEMQFPTMGAAIQAKNSLMADLGELVVVPGRNQDCMIGGMKVKFRGPDGLA